MYVESEPRLNKRSARHWGGDIVVMLYEETTFGIQRSETEDSEIDYNNRREADTEYRQARARIRIRGERKQTRKSMYGCLTRSDTRS